LGDLFTLKENLTKPYGTVAGGAPLVSELSFIGPRQIRAGPEISEKRKGPKK